MRKVKSMLLAFLAIVMVLSMSACGKSKTDSDLVGTWAWDYDLTDLMANALGEEYADFHSSLEISVRLQFNEDGTYSMYGDEAAFTESFNNWKEDFIKFCVDTTYAGFESEGYTTEEADETFAGLMGAGIEEYMRQVCEEMLDPSTLLQDVKSSGKYETSGDKLYLSEGSGDIDKSGYEVYSVSGDTLTLDLPEGASADSLLDGIEYPFILKKVS